MTIAPAAPPAPSARPYRRRGPRIAYAALIETGLILAIALAVDWYFFGGTRFRDVVPHPFWLIVLLISVQYGVAEGLIATAACSAALLIGNLPPQGVDQDVYTYWFKIAINPASWLAASVLFGELRARDKTRIGELRREAADANQRLDVLGRAYETTAAAKRELEARVAGQLKTVFAIYQAARAIEKLGPSEVLVGVTDLVRTVLAARKFSVYLLKGGLLEAVITEGWTAEDGYARSFDAGSSLFRSVIGGQQFLCIARDRDRDNLLGEGLLAGPLLGGDGTEVIGMLKVEDLAFLDLNLSTIENFGIVCEWIGQAFHKAQRFEAAASASLFTSDKSLLSAGFLERQIAFLTSLGNRVGFDVTLLMVQINGARDAEEAEKRRWARAVGEVVAEHLRNTDMAFDHRRSGYEFAVLLPATNDAEARIVVEKLIGAIRRRLGDSAADAARITVSVQTLVSARRPK